MDPRSRLVERPAGHFIPGVRNLYNRFRTEQARTKGYLRVQTSNAPQQVKYHLVSAIRLVIQQSNVALVHSQLAVHRASMPPLGPPLSRGDGTVMAPSLRTILVSFSCSPYADLILRREHKPLAANIQATWTD